jgi:hypothetical protein
VCASSHVLSTIEAGLLLRFEMFLEKKPGQLVSIFRGYLIGWLMMGRYLWF